MPLWGKNDAASNSVISVPAQFNKTPNTGNQTLLFGNTTADAFITGKTVGQFGVAPNEMTPSRSVSAVTVTAAGTGYTARPTVSIAAPNLANGVTALATSVGILLSAAPTTRGSGYVPGDVLTVAGGTGTSATANVAATEVNTIAIAVAGSGYANGDTVTVVSGTGTAATATVTTGVSNSIPASLTIASRGTYTANPTLAAAATTASSAGTGLTVNLTMGVKTLAVLTAGAYTVLPTLAGNALTGGAGTSVAATLVIGAGPVTVTTAGSGYTAAPVVTFGGAGGSGSTATAVLANAETSGIAHAGWNIRTVGSGGRAGRVQYECLVAMSSITGDASDDSILPE